MSEPTGDGEAAPLPTEPTPSTAPEGSAEPQPPGPPPPGWYPDPAGSGQPRYWDGVAWAGEPAPPGPARRRGRFVAVVVAVFVLLVAGAAGAVALARHKQSTPVAAATHVAGGTTVSARGVTVTLPAGWTNVPTSPEDFAKYLDKAGTTNPAMAKQLTAQMRAASSQSLVMFAIKTSDASAEFTTDADMGVVPGSGMDAADGIDPIERQLKAAGAENVTVVARSIAGHDAVFSTYDLRNVTSGLVVHGAQYTVLGPTEIAFLAVSTTGSDAAALAEQIASTITFD